MSANPPLRVAKFISTRRGDAERGPAVWMNADEANRRLILEGELAWVYGPSRHELATMHIDPTLPRGDVIVRDILGADPAQSIRIVKPDFDTDRHRGHFA